MATQRIAVDVNDVGMELRSHGTMQFPCASYQAAVYDSADGQIPWHWHEELELIYAVSGRITVQVPSYSFELKPGDLVFINSNVAHTVLSPEFGDLKSLVFHSSLLAGEPASIFAQRYLTPLVQAGQIPAIVFEQDAAAQLFETAFAALQIESFGYEFLVRQELSALILRVLERNSGVLEKPAQGADTDAVRLDKMLRFIHAHFEEPLKLSDIASAASVGERECLRCFKKTIGESPIQYLLRFRLEQARGALTTRQELAISDVATRHGFDSPSYFAQVFKRFYGLSPKQYRMKNSER